MTSTVEDHSYLSPPTGDEPFYAELRRLGHVWWWVLVYEYRPEIAARGWSLESASRWVGAYWVPGRRWATWKANRQVARRNNLVAGGFHGN